MKRIASILALCSLFLASASKAQTISGKDTETNKKAAVAFCQQLFGDHDFSAIDRYLADGYIQHNPGVADGKEALRAAAKIWLAHAPKIKLDIRNVAAEGDLVFIHFKVKNEKGNDAALVDIFRFKNNKIVEHWDVQQDVPAKSANPHPMF